MTETGKDITFEDIIGYFEIKQELMRFCDALKNRKYYAALGAEPPRGLLLHGVPGVGKTLMAAALIREVHEQLADALYDRGMLTLMDVKRVLDGCTLVKVGM